MTTHFLSVHEIRLVLSQTGDAEESGPLDIGSEQLGSGNNTETGTADSWSLDADSEQLDLDKKEGGETADSWSLDTDTVQPNHDKDNERECRDVDQPKVINRSESSPGTQINRQCQQRIDTLGKRKT